MKYGFKKNKFGATFHRLHSVWPASTGRLHRPIVQSLFGVFIFTTTISRYSAFKIIWVCAAHWFFAIRYLCVMKEVNIVETLLYCYAPATVKYGKKFKEKEHLTVQLRVLIL